ncbi:MAG TPA: CBS domain-containing protein [Gammaproteobacteria bacterium]
MFVEGMLETTRKRLATVSEDAPLIEAAAHLARPEITLVVACRADGTLAGVISKTDVMRQISRCQGSGCTVAASAVMTRDVITCRPTDWLADVWGTMRERRLKHVPVLDAEARPLGVLHARDALQVLLDEVESEELLLRDYVLGVGYR